MCSISPTPSALSQSSLHESTMSVSTEFRKKIKNMSLQELNDNISEMKELILESEVMSEERSSFVRRLIELRYRLTELSSDSSTDVVEPKSTAIADSDVFGHKFRQNSVKNLSSKVFCDQCCNVIWVFQQNYTCIDCFFLVHKTCLKRVERTCAHLIVCEKGVPEDRVCPEIGLAAQKYRCAGCSIQLMNKSCFIEPRKCFYSGLYYCKNCHWMDYSIIPGNITHNWDFEQRLVSRESLQEINLFYERPVIKLELKNAKLFVFVQKLGSIKKIRTYLILMKKYLDVCKLALSEKLIEKTVGSRRYLFDSMEYYSLYDLVCVENTSLNDYLNNVFKIFKSHIANCMICSAQAFLCEICGNNEKLYPFVEGTTTCKTCNNCYHRACFQKLVGQNCPKCLRKVSKAIES